MPIAVVNSSSVVGIAPPQPPVYSKEPSSLPISTANRASPPMATTCKCKKRRFSKQKSLTFPATRHHPYSNPANSSIAPKNLHQTSQITPSPQDPPAQCAGCAQKILDRYMLEAVGKFWHEDCLKCSACNCRLGEVGATLYFKQDLLLCRRDYLRMYGGLENRKNGEIL